MSYSELLTKTREYAVVTQLMGVLGAELRLRQMGQDGDPQVRQAMTNVLENLDPTLLDGLESGQAAAIVGHLTSALQDALEFISEPGRASGWVLTDPDILQERGRGSRAVARHIANLANPRPALQDALTNGDFLDIGTGVGWLAIEAANLWPEMRVVGIDIWEPSLTLAEANISAEGLQDRITLRRQNVSEIGDNEAFDVVWLPAGFLPRQVVIDALPRLNHALKPGGFLIFGGIVPSSGSLSQLLSDLQIIRHGGHPWRVEDVTEQLQSTGYSNIECVEGESGNNTRIIARIE